MSSSDAQKSEIMTPSVNQAQRNADTSQPSAQFEMTKPKITPIKTTENQKCCSLKRSVQFVHGAADVFNRALKCLFLPLLSLSPVAMPSSFSKHVHPLANKTLNRKNAKWKSQFKISCASFILQNIEHKLFHLCEEQKPFSASIIFIFSTIRSGCCLYFDMTHVSYVCMCGMSATVRHILNHQVTQFVVTNTGFMSPPGSLCRLWFCSRFCHHHRPLCDAPWGESSIFLFANQSRYEFHTGWINTSLILHCHDPGSTWPPRQVGLMFTDVALVSGSV